MPLNKVLGIVNQCFAHSPGHEKRVVGEGMPLVEDPTKRGDLIVKFQLKFPSALDGRQKQLLKQALA